MVACERLQGMGKIVSDCKGAAVVANKLKAGLRAPRGRHSRIETSIRDSIGQIEVQWMRSHLEYLTAQQAADADLPTGYLTGNAEADLLAGSSARDSCTAPTFRPFSPSCRRSANFLVSYLFCPGCF
eukprot:2675307-Amphidinium_carterae.1